MDELLKQFPNKEAFDAYWNEEYKELSYEDVKEAFEDFVKASDKHIFIEDYESAGAIRKEDFAQNLSETAMFTFQDTLTEVFYEKNPDLYEMAFALYEMAQMGEADKSIAMIFHEEYNRLYKEFLDQMFEHCFA